MSYAIAAARKNATPTAASRSRLRLAYQGLLISQPPSRRGYCLNLLMRPAGVLGTIAAWRGTEILID